MKWKKVAALLGCALLTFTNSTAFVFAEGNMLTVSETGFDEAISENEELFEDIQTEENGESEDAEYSEEDSDNDTEESDGDDDGNTDAEQEELDDASGEDESITDNHNPAETVPSDDDLTDDGLTDEEATDPENPSSDSNSVNESSDSDTADDEKINSETQNNEAEKPDKKKDKKSHKKSKSDQTSEVGEDIFTLFQGGVASGSNLYDPSWYIDPDFRFTQVEKECAIAEPDRGTANVYDTSDRSGNVIGKLPYFSVAYVLEEGDTWSYIESGNVRGFVENTELNTGDYANEVLTILGENTFSTGLEVVKPYENRAFTHTHTTTKDVIAEKQYAVTIYSCDIKEYPKEEARAIGEAASGDIVYILDKDPSGWYFVESGDVRGFVDPSLVMKGDVALDFAKVLGGDTQLVKEVVKPSDNESLYYTLKSVKVAGSGIGNAIAQEALGYIGKLSYVWGGSSLTSGADCSGFVQSLFASHGISLPRIAEEQGIGGMEVSSLSEAKCGDVIYYASGPHVGIYVGDGKVVQCSGDSYNTSDNPGKGPTLSNASYMPITSIRRYLIENENVIGDSGNKLDQSFYTKEQLELIWAIVAQEDNGSYEGALAVISSAMNRSESDNWKNCGNNALTQLTASGQYCYSLDDYWRDRLNGNVPDYVKEAVNDCLKKGIRNHKFTSFRSTLGKTTGSDAKQIGGNWYFGV